jgi:energy-converting hydrogenase B subunit D
MSLLIGLLFLLVAATGTTVALSRVPRRQVMAMAANGLALALLFMALQAPDVAFAELAVGTAVLPLLFLIVLASVRSDLLTRRVKRPKPDAPT